MVCSAVTNFEQTYVVQSSEICVSLAKSPWDRTFSALQAPDGVSSLRMDVTAASLHSDIDQNIPVERQSGSSCQFTFRWLAV